MDTMKTPQKYLKKNKSNEMFSFLKKVEKF